MTLVTRLSSLLEWLADLDVAIDLGERTAWEPCHGGTLGARARLVALTEILRPTVPVGCPAALRVAVETSHRGALSPTVVAARDALEPPRGVA